MHQCQPPPLRICINVNAKNNVANFKVVDCSLEPISNKNFPALEPGWLFFCEMPLVYCIVKPFPDWQAYLVLAWPYYSRSSGAFWTLWYTTGLSWGHLKLAINFIILTEILDCALNPCHNEGTCIEEAFGYKCKCLQGFTGDYCDTGWISNVLFLFDNLFLCINNCSCNICKGASNFFGKIL